MSRQTLISSASREADSGNSPFTCFRGSSSHRGGRSRDEEVREELLDMLLDSQFKSVAGSIAACGNATIEIKCNDCDHRTQVTHHCDNRVCDKCGGSRWKRTVEGLRERVFSKMDWSNVRFMTLTVPNVVDLEKADIQDIRENFKRLKRRERFKNRIWGGVYSIECNRTVEGWNLHLHVVYEGVYIDQEVLSDAWEDLTGAPVVDIRKADDTDGAVQELAKYISKKPDVVDEDTDMSIKEEARLLFQYHRAMYRTNLIQPFGKFHHSSDKAVSIRWTNLSYECPECGSEDITVVPVPLKIIACIMAEKNPPNYVRYMRAKGRGVQTVLA